MIDTKHVIIKEVTLEYDGSMDILNTVATLNEALEEHGITLEIIDEEFDGYEVCKITIGSGGVKDSAEVSRPDIDWAEVSRYMGQNDAGTSGTSGSSYGTSGSSYGTCGTSYGTSGTSYILDNGWDI